MHTKCNKVYIHFFSASRFGCRFTGSVICLNSILLGLNQYNDVYDAGRMVLWSASSQRISSGYNDSILERRVPSVFLIGAGKCGTGALMAFMNMHPSIVTKGGEMLYFGVDHDKG